MAYLTERQQTGVPIGSFRALQHVTADMFSETELCRSAMILAASQVDSPDDEIHRSDVSAAKLQLADGGWFVQESAIQLFGGIGVTDEPDEGLFFKRLRVLNGLSAPKLLEVGCPLFDEGLDGFPVFGPAEELCHGLGLRRTRLRNIVFVE